MNNHRCISQKSLISIRKWLLDAGDGPSPSFCSPSSKFNCNIKQKSGLDKIMKRKKHKNYKYYSKSTSIFDWFYEFIKKIFTNHERMDDTSLSTITYSTCHYNEIRNPISSTLKSNNSSSILYSKIKSKLMRTTATSSSNLNFLLLKSVQTQTNTNEQQSSAYPLYCFSIKDGQILPLMLSLPSSSLPISINNEKSESITNLSTASSDSNIISLQTIENIRKNKINHPLPSLLHDTHNCLIECYQSSNTNSSETIFAESTCQLIKQAWRSSTINS
ncbi:unnamed protein product [Adineta steineri]|uniref:Uncharacterized protein n=1 Tax=Adineta steineri TaxID=433720 RepID=A0A815P679_9BILA|nr:unnamed protein product [Adineta steineri]CAF1444650.1 unnamed protein product [Adineta steineri]